MKRLLERDIDELRSEYLFDFARICSIPPPMVDVLRYLDFLSFVLHIDAYREFEKKRLEVAPWLSGT